MRIAINGVGIAGPTLAYWLRKSGHEVLLVEEAPQLRSGGYVIDFWGVGYDIAEKMGLIPRIRELGYQVREVRFVDRHGRKSGGFSVDVFGRLTNGRFTSLRRSDLAATIYQALDGKVETIFGDSVARIEDDGQLRAGQLRSCRPARGRSGHRRRRAAFARPPARVRARSRVRSLARLSRRRVRGRGVSAARRTRLCQPRRPGKTGFAIFHARRQDALPLRFSRRVPDRRESLDASKNANRR